MTASASTASVVWDVGYSSWMGLQQHPARATVSGTVHFQAGGSSLASPFFLSVTGMQEHYNVTTDLIALGAGSNRFSFRAMLNPTQSGADYTISVMLGDGSAPDGAVLRHVAFGDVWLCSGQSNMLLPLRNTFSRNRTVDAIRRGKYGNIRIAGGKMASTHRHGSSRMQWLSARASLSGGNASAPEYPLFDFCSTCWYFGEALTDAFAGDSRPPPPIGLICAGADGSEIEQLAPRGSLSKECAHAGVAPRLNEGSVFTAELLPLVGMSLKGWLFYQGEFNVRTNAVSGNSEAGLG
mgnify:CR=1 FL=1